MAIICPTVTAYEPHQYREQMEQIDAFAERVHIDLMDGDFAPTKSPALSQIWWPHHILADIHLMYRRPMDYLELLIKLQPKIVVIHFEAEVDHMHFAAELHKAGIDAGLALLQTTTVEDASRVMDSFDQVLIFSGDLGHHGGKADMGLLNKVSEVSKAYPDIEIAWDGGISDQNAKALVAGGVDVLNVGGFVQKSDNPADAYAKLKKQI